MADTIYDNLKQLGGETRLPTSPDEAELNASRTRRAMKRSKSVSRRRNSHRFAR